MRSFERKECVQQDSRDCIDIAFCRTESAKIRPRVLVPDFQGFMGGKVRITGLPKNPHFLATNRICKDRPGQCEFRASGI